MFTTKEPGKGTGLGLSAVSGIVKKHRGAVTIDTEVGGGTSVNLYLPICFEQLPSDETREEAPDIVGNEHVLFVDDEAAVLHLGTAILERVGYRVTTATDGIDAKQKLKAGWKQFDIVVTDVTMPNMTGIELAKFVREIHPEFPVILSTGYSGAVSDQLIKELTIDHLLMKPYRPTVLEDVVRKALDSRALV